MLPAAGGLARTLCPHGLPQPWELSSPSFQPSPSRRSHHCGAGSKELLALQLLFPMFLSQISFLGHESFLVPRESRIWRLHSMR